MTVITSHSLVLYRLDDCIGPQSSFQVLMWREVTEMVLWQFKEAPSQEACLSRIIDILACMITELFGCFL